MCDDGDVCDDEYEVIDVCEEQCDPSHEGEECYQDCDAEELEINQCQQEDDQYDHEWDYYHHDQYHPGACTRCPYYSHP